MRPFSLLVKPAGADCNLACSYCFYLPKKGLYPETPRPRMAGEVLERIVRSYLATSQEVHALCWQGGEPTLMGLDFFRRVTDLEQSLGRPGTMVQNMLQTNGLLLDDEFAAHLAEYRFLVGLSLDGPAEIHDAQRRDASGHGSHAAAMRAAGILRSRGVAANVLVLVTAASAGRGAEIYRWLVDQGFLDHHYIPCVERDESGKPAAFSIRGGEWGKFLLDVFESWHASDVGKVSVRLFDALVAKASGIGNFMCTLGDSCRSYFLVEHQGDVYPCDFYADPAWKIGNVMRDSWEDLLASPVYARFAAAKSILAPQCRDCGFLDLCAGDCPRNRARGRRGLPGRSLLCDGWRAFLGRTRETWADLASNLEVRKSGKDLNQMNQALSERSPS